MSGRASLPSSPRNQIRSCKKCGISDRRVRVGFARRVPCDGSETDRTGCWQSIDVTFSDGSDVSSINRSDFLITQVPFGLPIQITSVEPVDEVTARLHFSRVISTERWTCVEYLPWGGKSCIGHLPGDVNGDGTASPGDILSEIDCLNIPGMCELYQCGVDRSGVYAPGDILAVVDLLNGADAYDPWLGASLPDCPTAR